MNKLLTQTSSDGSRTPTRAASSTIRFRTWTLAVLTVLIGLGFTVDLAAPQRADAQTSSPSPSPWPWPSSTPTTTPTTTQSAVVGAARGTVHQHIGDPGTRQVMTVPDRSTANGAPIVTRAAFGNLTEGWGLVDTGAGGGYYQLRNLGSGLCLEMPGVSAPNGTAAQQYQCDPNSKNQPNQLWQRISKGGNLYVLRNKASGLTLFRAADGRVIQSTSATAWAFQPPRDVQLVCTGANYSGACIGSIRTSYGPAEDRLWWTVTFSHLDATPVAGRTIWSIFNGGDVPTGVVLFSGPAFSGTCRHFTASDANLSDNVSSIQELPRPASAIMDLTCPPPSGLWVCSDPHFRTTCKGVSQNISNMSQLGFNDVTSSIYMTSGNTAALYSDVNFEGTCETLTASELNLQDNMIGDNRVSSIWLGHRCEQDVQLCDGPYQTGRCVSFRSDKPSLARTDIGNDAASSVRVPAGWQISVWSDDNYLGLVDALNGEIERNFGAGAGSTSYGATTVTGVPDNSASSLDIRIYPSSSNPCTDRYGCLFNLG